MVSNDGKGDRALFAGLTRAADVDGCGVDGLVSVVSTTSSCDNEKIGFIVDDAVGISSPIVNDKFMNSVKFSTKFVSVVSPT